MEKEILNFLLNNCRLDMVVILVALWYIYKNALRAQRKMDTLEKDFRTGLDELKGATRAGLLSHITRIFDGATKNGCISIDTARIVEECYTNYHACGGDGLATNMMKIIRKLPVKN